MNKANLRGLLTEATSAEEEIVLSNETTTVTTSTAIQLHSKIKNNYQQREPGPYSRG